GGHGGSKEEYWAKSSKESAAGHSETGGSSGRAGLRLVLGAGNVTGDDRSSLQLPSGNRLSHTLPWPTLGSYEKTQCWAGCSRVLVAREQRPGSMIILVTYPEKKLERER